jgi:hypothetical protein
MLEELVSISETLIEGRGQQARALYKLSELYTRKDMAVQSKKCREEDLQLRNELKLELSSTPFEEEQFNKLCLWMLW